MADTDQPAERDVIHDIGYTAEGLFAIRHIVDQQQDAGQYLQAEDNQQDTAHGVPDVDVARQEVTGQLLRNNVPGADAHVDPVIQVFKQFHAVSRISLPLLNRISALTKIFPANIRRK